MNTNTITREEVINQIISYFNDNEDILNEVIEELDSYNGYLGDDRYYSMDEFNMLIEGLTPYDIALRIFNGYHEGGHEGFNPNADYFYFNAYGNLVSAWYKDYSDYNDKWLVEAIQDNRNNLDYSITPELDETLDILENVEG